MKAVIFQGKSGHFYWRLKAKNGRTIADGAEGYVRQAGALGACLRLAQAAGDSPLGRAFARVTTEGSTR